MPIIVQKCFPPSAWRWAGEPSPHAMGCYMTKRSLFTALESEWKYCRFAMYWANCAPTVILPWFYLQKAPLSLQRLSEKTQNHRSELLLKYHRFAKFLLKYQDFKSTPHPQGGRPWPRGGKSMVLKPYAWDANLVPWSIYWWFFSCLQCLTCQIELIEIKPANLREQLLTVIVTIMILKTNI